MRTTIKMAGLREMDAALGELSKAVARGVLQRVGMKALEPMYLKAVVLAPERSGVLKRHILKTTKKPKGHSSKAAFSAAMAQGATRDEAVAAQRAFNRDNGATLAEVFVGVAEGVAQAWPQEVGTINHGPHPYIRPAFDEHAEEALGIVRDELKPEIAAAAERARRRALRKALKG